MYIRGQGKIGYITGDKKAPALNNPLHAIWDAENSMVMTWLVNSMEEDISTNYMCYPTTKELWDNVSQMYSDLAYTNGNLLMTATTTRKPWKTVVFTNFLLVSTSNLMKYEEGLLGDFLSHPLVKYLPKSEEKKAEGVSCSEKGVPCDFCNKPRHTRETCWKIYGKPANWKNSKQGEKNRGIPIANEADSGSFNKEQMDQLLKLIKSNFSSRIPSVSLAQIGSNPKALHMSEALSCLNSSPWIIDSGATDHMSSCSHLFDTYSPCSGNEKIRIADGSFSPIVGK
ncbi:hypothetical protein ZIOFF_028179 [Zingiber officinale]|uniref:Retrovirus-related Pol polyprotein from transposon TNT 1-94-like beta-barrel domain-containing protein n=1 Tax=Zingiber officinale TaxID=94328 RepID=A0A8J5GMH6_ZINOF|nr:hypothetical protein ZIOFF_028179 [Zingiber officinale]